MIHLISKEYYLKNRTQGKQKKIIIPDTKFPNVQNQFFMKSGECFVYLQNLGFVIVSENSKITSDTILEDLDTEHWYLEKYDIPMKLTKNYINLHLDVEIYETPGKEWLKEYQGFLRVWNTYTNEDFIFYKTKATKRYDNSKSYICKLIVGNEVKFPIDIYKAKEFNNLLKDILEWI